MRKKVLISAGSDTEFKIDKITRSAEENITVMLQTIQEGRQYQLIIEIKAGFRPGRIEGVISLYTTHPLQKIIKIPVWAWVI